MLLRYKCHTFQSHAYKACNFVVPKWYKSTFACFLTFEGSSHALRLVPFLPARTKETTSKYLHDEVTQQNQWLPNIFTPKRYQFKTTQEPTL